MTRRIFLKGLGAFLSLLKWPSAFAAAPAPFRMAFGSCMFQDKPAPIWATIAQAKPDVFVFLGDNIYADTFDMSVMAAKYEQMEKNRDYARFRDRFKIVGTWDDHDYGGNDFGGEYPKKRESKELLMNFLREPKNSPRRKRDGVYTSYVYGKAPHRVQLILMDLRWFRSHLKDDKDPTTYLPEYSPSATMLGEEQWRWLEAELQKPAEVRVIGSSTQFLGAEHRFEKWANMPLEKDKLLKLIDRFKLKNTFVISGDMHFGEITRGFTPAGQEIVDLTSSGLNRFQSAKPFPNSKRFGLYDTGPNFGLIGFDWAQQKVVLELRKLDGGVAFAHTLKIESLSV